MNASQLSKNISKATGIMAIAAGLMILTGWILEIQLSRSFLPDWISMKANSAIAFVFSGMALVHLQSEKKNIIKKTIDIMLALPVFLIGLLTMIEYLFSVNSGIVTSFHSAFTGFHASSFSDRMSPLTAFNFTLLGIVLSLFQYHKKGIIIIVQIATIIITIIAVMSFIGYFYNEIYFFGYTSLKSMNFITALIFLLISLGILIHFRFYGPVKLMVKKASISTLITGAVVILIFIGAFTFNDQKLFIDNQESSNSTLQVLTTIELTLSLLKDAETGQRGYLITGDRSFLEPYNKVIFSGEIGKAMNNLRKYIKDEAQLRIIGRIDGLIDKKLSIISDSIEFMELKGFDYAREKLMSGQGKESMDEIRMLFDELKKEEKKSFDRNRKISAGSLRKFNITLIAGYLLIFIVFSLMIFFIKNTEIKNRKIIELELIKKNEELDQFFNVSLDLLSISNSEGYFIRLNPSWEKTLGFTIEELISKPLIDFIHPEDIEPTRNVMEIRAEGNSVYSFVNRYRCKDGSFRFLEWKSVPVKNHLYSAAHDITDRMRNEDEIKKLNSVLVSTNKELENFCYSVSHDLRAPLRGIDGWSLALEEDYGKMLDETAKGYINTIRSESQRMAELIDSLLILSRVSMVDMKFEWLDMSELAWKIADELRKEQPSRTVDFMIEPDLNVIGEKSLVLSLLRNLIGNAWKYTGKCDHACIEFGKKTENDKTIYFVHDNGAGFDMNYIDKLFTPFYRLHSPLDFPGSGIGLATVNRIITKHGGKIWAESAPGKGAAFYFMI